MAAAQPCRPGMRDQASGQHRGLAPLAVAGGEAQCGLHGSAEILLAQAAGASLAHGGKNGGAQQRHEQEIVEVTLGRLETWGPQRLRRIETTLSPTLAAGVLQ